MVASVSAASGTRGERNSNPGNLQFMKQGMWRGQVGLEPVPPGMKYTPRFGVYASDHDGIRALAKQLITYQQRDALRTIRQMINRWAPPSDGNQTTAYVVTVCGACGAGPDDPYPLAALSKLMPMVKAVIKVENGRVVYDDQLITDACRDALGLPVPPITKV